MSNESNICVADDVVLGKDVKLNKFINLYGCTIGDYCMIGAFVEIQKDVVIGNHCRIQSHTFICSGVRLDDYVFVGHGVMFVNDNHPSVDKTEKGTWQMERTVVRELSNIGSGAVILGGITIGRCAMIGAGAVVTKDVLAYQVVTGVPARSR